MQYIVFDLEATCWEKTPKAVHQINEIIEIGAARLDENAQVADTFQTFVRPTKNPTLSDFCTKLTSIIQADVDGAPMFADAMKSFEDWIGDSPDTVLLSWGAYDKNQIQRESKLKEYSGDILALLEHHRNFKAEFADLRNVRPCGMSQALRLLEIPLAGTQHRGIDDALNISAIFAHIYRDWEKLNA